MLNGPKACQGGHPCEPVGLKEALHCGVQHNPIDGSLVDPVATILNIRPQTLRDAINPNEPDWLASKHLDAIAKFTDNHPVIARHFAKLQGGFFYKVNRGTPSLDRETARSVREFGEFLMSLPVGPVTPEIAAQVEREGYDAMASIKSLMDAVRLRAAIEDRR